MALDKKFALRNNYNPTHFGANEQAKTPESNSVLTKMSDGVEPMPIVDINRINQRIQKGLTKVSEFRTKATELFDKTAKATSFFTQFSSTEAPYRAKSFDTEPVVQKEVPKSVTETSDAVPVTSGEAVETAENEVVTPETVSLETIAETKTAADAGETEAMQATTEAKTETSALTSDVTPARILETRSRIQNGVEKTAEAGQKKLNFFQLAALVIKEMWRKAKRALEIKSAELLAKSEDPETARTGKEILARLRPKIDGVEKLRALYPNLPVNSNKTLEIQQAVTENEEAPKEEGTIARRPFGPVLAWVNPKPPETAQKTNQEEADAPTASTTPTAQAA